MIPMLKGEYVIEAFCDINAELAGKDIEGYEIISVGRPKRCAVRTRI